MNTSSPKPDHEREREIMSGCLEALAAFIQWGARGYKLVHPETHAEVLELAEAGRARLIIRLEESAEQVRLAYCIELVDAETPKELFFLAAKKPGATDSPLH